MEVGADPALGHPDQDQESLKVGQDLAQALAHGQGLVRGRGPNLDRSPDQDLPNQSLDHALDLPDRNRDQEHAQDQPDRNQDLVPNLAPDHDPDLPGQGNLVLEVSLGLVVLPNPDLAALLSQGLEVLQVRIDHDQALHKSRTSIATPTNYGT